MIDLLKFRISPESKCITIKASLTQNYWTRKTIISHVRIYTADDYNPLENSEERIKKAKYTTEVNNIDVDINIPFNDPNLLIKSSDITRTMLFVEFQIGGTINPEAPCEYSKDFEVKVLIDKTGIYKRGMKLFNSVATDCDIPRELINFIIQLKGIDYALQIGNYTQAKKLYNRFINFSTNVSTSNCGCHG